MGLHEKFVTNVKFSQKKVSYQGSLVFFAVLA